MLQDVVQADRLGFVDQVAEHAASLGQRTDELTGLGVDALVDELDQFVVVAAHAQRPVPGVHQVDGGVHDGLQGDVQFQTRGHHQHGFHQAVEPVTAPDDLLHPVLDLDEQLAQPQLGKSLTQRRCCPLAPLRADIAGHGLYGARSLPAGSLFMVMALAELGDEHRRLGASLHAQLRQQP